MRGRHPSRWRTRTTTWRGGGSVAVRGRGCDGAGGRVRRAGSPARGPGCVDTRDPVASVHGVLAAFPGEWLLIFDNAPDRASVEAFLPPDGPGQVLITSQNPAWPGQPLNVPMLDLDVAAGFLVDRTSDPDLQAARDLADALGGLPLALSRPPHTSRPLRALWPVTWPCSGTGGLSCFPVAGRPDTTRRWPAPGRWRSTACSRPHRTRSACCGCWRSARPRQSRCACCCTPPGP